MVQNMVRNVLLACGILSSVVYLAIDLAGWAAYPGYQFAGQTISELSAIGAPSRAAVAVLGAWYEALLVAFGAGVFLSAAGRPALRACGFLLIASAVFGSFWPPMHMRGAGFGTTDVLHIVWTAGWLLLTLAALVLAAAARGTRFRYYTAATIAVMLVFGTLTGLQASRIPAQLATPWIGLTERANIGAFLLWIVVLAWALLREGKGRAADVTSWAP